MDKKTQETIITLYRQGLTLKDIAKVTAIPLGTINSERKKNDALDTALRQSAQYADAIVESALFRRATGYEQIEEVHTESKTGEVKVKRIHKTIAPDVVACIFWLKNRQPDRWRERKDDDQPIEVTVLMEGAAEEYSE